MYDEFDGVPEVTLITETQEVMATEELLKTQESAVTDLLK